MVCQKREFAARSKFQDVKFTVPKFNEIFVRIDMKHLYISNSNYFIISLQSFFSVVFCNYKLIELFVLCQKLIPCLCIIFVPIII